jgi:hypothetical protein
MRTSLYYGCFIGVLFFIAAAIDENIRSVILWRILKAPPYPTTPLFWEARVLSDIITGMVGFCLGFVIGWVNERKGKEYVERFKIL